MSELAIQTKILIKNYSSVRALRLSGTGGWKMPAWMTMDWWLSLSGKQK
jgi:hypothetical protein